MKKELDKNIIDEINNGASRNPDDMAVKWDDNDFEQYNIYIPTYTKRHDISEHRSKKS